MVKSMTFRSAMLAATSVTAIGFAVPAAAAVDRAGGYNDPSCVVTPAHPHPVILLHGLTSSAAAFDREGPLLASRGYCAYAYTYGASALAPTIGGVTDMVGSARVLSSHVNTVLGETGAATVDLVGESEGSTISAYYIKVLGGAPKVDRLVGVSPNYGGTAQAAQLAADAGGAVAAFCDACDQFATDSPFMARLNAGGTAAVASVRYTNIRSIYDEVVVPHSSAVLHGPNITDVVVQTGCRQDHGGHVATIASPRALQLTLTALDPATATPAPCAADSGP
jgi:triacylglycerol lipase